ncbi:MAG: metallophosphoesterase [Propionibacteriaceae bacterium]|nr:metallophosphoesterase [Propionibacteriaceae bacterium]
MKTLVGLAGAGAGVAAYASLIERTWFALRTERVPVLPQGHPPIKILHLSDTHLMPGQKKKIAWVRQLAEWSPDLVIATGDFISSPKSLPDLSRMFEPFWGVPGFFVFGSNDFFEPIPVNPLRYLKSRSTVTRRPTLPTGALKTLFEEGGWVDLEERRFETTVAGTTIEFRGCGDAHINRAHYEMVAGQPDSSADLAIGVTHSPYLRVLDAMTDDGLDLIVAGHTHGGQVCLPGYGALVTNCDLDRGRVKGLHHHRVGLKRSFLQVSAGLGTSPYAPYRFCCRPEASLLMLVPRDS